MQKIGDNQPSPLTIPRPTATIMDVNHLWHCHQILILQLPRHNPALQRVQRSLIALHIGGVAVELRHEYEEMAMVIKQSYNKCVPEIMGGNLDYLLCLAQMDKQEPLPPV